MPDKQVIRKYMYFLLAGFNCLVIFPTRLSYFSLYTFNFACKCGPINYTYFKIKSKKFYFINKALAISK